MNFPYMNKKLKIPFIKSRGFECGQACTAMVIKYFKPGFESDFEEMNGVIKHKAGKYTFPQQLVLLLDYYGIKGKCFSSELVNTTYEDPDQFRRWYGNDYEQQMKLVDIDSFDWMVETMRQKNLFVKKATDFEEIIELFKHDKVVYFPIDWTSLNQQTGNYVGHFVVLTGIEGDKCLIHDPDVGSYVRYPREILQKAWEHPIITDDLIVADGEK